MKKRRLWDILMWKKNHKEKVVGHFNGLLSKIIFVKSLSSSLFWFEDMLQTRNFAIRRMKIVIIKYKKFIWI